MVAIPASCSFELRQGQKSHECSFQPRNTTRHLRPQSNSAGATEFQTEADPCSTERRRYSKVASRASVSRTNACATRRRNWFANERTACLKEKVYDPIFAKIDFNVDVEGRRGRYAVVDLIESEGEPIKNPVTGAETRARIDLPNGFEYEIAEIGSGTTKTQGRIQLDLKASYGQFAHLHLNNKGVVRHRPV